MLRLVALFVVFFGFSAAVGSKTAVADALGSNTAGAGEMAALPGIGGGFGSETVSGGCPEVFEPPYVGCYEGGAVAARVGRSGGFGGGAAILAGSPEMFEPSYVGCYEGRAVATRVGQSGGFGGTVILAGSPEMFEPPYVGCYEGGAVAARVGRSGGFGGAAILAGSPEMFEPPYVGCYEKRAAATEDGAVATSKGRSGGIGARPGHPLFRDFMGINGHTVQFRPQLYRPVAGLVRDYHPAEWDLGDDSGFATRLPMARNGVDWNKVYGSWRKEGWRIDASVMFETLPRERWKDLARDAKAYAERLAESLGPSGTNALLESVEIGNEPGKWSDADYRVIFENMARGLKERDPRLRVATCALVVGKSHDYAKSVECVAGLEKLYDILNVHSYAQLENWPTWRRGFPEDSRLKEYLPDIKRLCEWRDEHAPEKEVWLTEFGYDASTRKPKADSEFKQWVGVTEEQQAQWTVRSWLVFATLPIQRAYVYFFNDDDSPQLHGSSGLTRNYVPKPAFYAAAHLYRSLGDYRFERIALERPGEALVYEFTHEKDRERRVWVAWSPTGTNRVAELELPDYTGKIERAESMPITDSGPISIPIAPRANRVPIAESPLFLFLRKD